MTIDWGGDAAPVEPHAGFRLLAQMHRQLFLAYTEAGFDAEESLALVVASMPLLLTTDDPC